MTRRRSVAAVAVGHGVERILKKMTAQEITLRIEEHFGSGWKNSGTDGFQAGKPTDPVTGIATAWTPSLDVLQQAVKSKQNLVITVQSPYWPGQGGGGGGGRASSRVPSAGPNGGRAAKGGGRGAGPLPGLRAENTDLYQFKKKYIEDHGLILWRFSENWLSLPTQPRLRGLAGALGWAKQQDLAASERVSLVGAGVYALPAGRLSGLAAQIKSSLGLRAMRVLGDPNATVSRVVVRPGYLTVPDALQMVRSTKADVVVCGESCEWEVFPFYEDWVTAGSGKAFIMLGHAASEKPGTLEMAAWIKALVSEVPVSAILSEEPFSLGVA